MVYFQWALNSHNKRHSELTDQYGAMRHEFNTTSLYSKGRSVQQGISTSKIKLTPIDSSFNSSTDYIARISKVAEFITLKSPTNVLPEFEILREDAEMLCDILP